MVRAPYPAAARLGLWWLAHQADISGRCRLAGIELETLPLAAGLDVIYALILDEADPPRREARERLDQALERPLEPDQAEQYDRERWGLDAEALAQAERKDRMFGEVSYQ